MLRRLACSLTLALLACVAAASGHRTQPQQQPQSSPPAGQSSGKPLPDRWQNLILDQTTPEEALALLGKPASDKVDPLQIHNIDRWISLRRKDKIFRKLTWKKPAGAHKLDLAFLDGKLVMMRVYYEKKQLPAEELAPAFGINFIGVEKVSPNPLEYEQNAVTNIENYPMQYYAVAVSPNSFLSALVVDPNIKRLLKRMVSVPVEGYLPGQVALIEIVSRRLEKI
jgi:hypothetical protein